MESQVDPSDTDSDQTSSESESEAITEDFTDEMVISKSVVESNYRLMDTVYTPETSPLVLSELRLAHPSAFTPASERALAAALTELSLPFPLSDFQTFSVNALLNNQDLLCVMPTGQRCIFLIVGIGAIEVKCVMCNV